MIIRIWDWFFTRRVWTVVEERNWVNTAGKICRKTFIMKDQFGNLKTFGSGPYG